MNWKFYFALMAVFALGFGAGFYCEYRNYLVISDLNLTLWELLGNEIADRNMNYVRKDGLNYNPGSGLTTGTWSKSEI
jgi:hypothetical protein